jgi:hypothetical protein
MSPREMCLNCKRKVCAFDARGSGIDTPPVVKREYVIKRLWKQKDGEIKTRYIKHYRCKGKEYNTMNPLKLATPFTLEQAAAVVEEIKKKTDDELIIVKRSEEYEKHT